MLRRTKSNSDFLPIAIDSSQKPVETVVSSPASDQPGLSPASPPSAGGSSFSVQLKPADFLQQAVKTANSGAGEVSWLGMPLKYLSLVILILQNTSLVLMMRYSRTANDDPKVKNNGLYISSTAVVMIELVKIITCVVLLYYHHRPTNVSHVVASASLSGSQSKRRSTQVSFGGFAIDPMAMRRFWAMLRQDVFDSDYQWVKMIVPSGIYAIQTNLLFAALTHLDAATFQITYQLKILTTALFSVWMLGKQISQYKWTSLLMLTVGVAIVQLSGTSTSKQTASQSQNPFIGLSAVLTACFSSGFAGVYFERILKQAASTGITASNSGLSNHSKLNQSSMSDLWVRNIQLGIFGLVFSLITSFTQDASKIAELGFFINYNFLTWLVILNQALGGLIVAVVVKYADNILKGFATSVSILVSGIVSWLIFGFVPSFLFVCGGSIVLIAGWMYGRPEPPAQPKKI